MNPDFKDGMAKLREALPAGLEAEFEHLVRSKDHLELRDSWEEALYCSQEWDRIFPNFWERFRPGLFHLTTSANWIAIERCGKILPSGSGYRGLHSLKEGYKTQAEERNAVALFNTGAPTLPQIFRCSRAWFTALLTLTEEKVSRSVDAIWLQLDEDILARNIERSDPYNGFSLPHIEYHHRGSISIDLVTAVYHLRKPGIAFQTTRLR